MTASATSGCLEVSIDLDVTITLFSSKLTKLINNVVLHSNPVVTLVA